MAASIMSGNQHAQTGFAYMALLTVIAASLIALTVAMPDIYQQAQREREAQLFFVGLQYQQAIKRFYHNPHVSQPRYPNSLEELLKDNRSVKATYHLRRLYRDPMTESGEWSLILNENKQIIGVKSQSTATLLKTNLPAEGISIGPNKTGQTTYADLQFVYQSQQNKP